MKIHQHHDFQVTLLYEQYQDNILEMNDSKTEE